MIFDSEQLMSGGVRESAKTIGKATKDSHEFDTGRTHNQHSPRC